MMERYGLKVWEMRAKKKLEILKKASPEETKRIEDERSVSRLNHLKSQMLNDSVKLAKDLEL